MIKQILSYRSIAVVIAFFIFINAIAFTILGAYMSCRGVYLIFKGEMLTDSRPGLLIMESIDIFLLALVFMVFAIGIIKLFVPDAHQSITVRSLHWLKIRDFSDLKMLLWEAVLTTLVVFFITGYVHQEDHIDWKIMILPASILLLAISYYIMKKSEPEHHPEDDQTPPVE